MKKISNIIVALLSLGSVALLITLIRNYPAEGILEPLSKVGPIHVLILLGLFFVYFLLYCVRWQRILKLEGLNISLKDLIAYKFAGYSFSYLTPLADYGGEPVIAYLMKSEHPEFGFSRSLASIIATRIISAVPEAIFLITSISYILFFFVLPQETTFIFYILLGLVALLMVFIYQMILKRRHPLSRIIKFFKLNKVDFIEEKMDEVEEFDDLLNNLFHDNPVELSINFIISFLALSTVISMFWLLAESLGLSMNVLDAITVRSITSVIGSLIPVPANIGLGEGGVSAWFSIIGLGAAQGFGFYLLIRAKDIVFTIIGVIILVNKGFWKNIKKIQNIISENKLLKLISANGEDE